MTMDSNYLRREQQMRNDGDRQTPHTTIETWQIEQENAQQGDIPGEATADVQDVKAKKGGFLSALRKLLRRK